MNTAASSPNLLLIGFPRCGTTALVKALNQHAEIRFCEPKEPHFLALGTKETIIKGPGSEAFDDEHVYDRIRWQALFGAESGSRYIGDASVTTVSYSDMAIKNIDKYCDDDCRFIVMLRHPVDRAFSSYLYCLSRGWIAGSFEQGLEEEAQRRASNWQHLWFFSWLSLYRQRLAPFIDHYGRERFHFIVSEEFTESPDAVLSDLFEFLELENMAIDTQQKINVGGNPRSKVLAQTMSFLRKNGFIRELIKSTTSQSFRESIRKKNLTSIDMLPETRSRLESEFQSTIDWTESLLGRELPCWKKN
ncbi:sulfotransferase family protein [Granulosicoccus sp. 3-233]|uniref:sulfotransferase family protein n=1 Tax=Granulosicoccus sp. 3-233 TaxID=3417969 RepID=UPI003D34B2B6